MISFSISSSFNKKIYERINYEFFPKNATKPANAYNNQFSLHKRFDKFSMFTRNRIIFCARCFIAKKTDIDMVQLMLKKCKFYFHSYLFAQLQFNELFISIDMLAPPLSIKMKTFINIKKVF